MKVGNDGSSLSLSRISKPAKMKKLFTIFNCDFKKQLINCPKSLEAMKSLGYCMDDLLSIEFNDFININGQVKTLSKELQQMRYDAFESGRWKKIYEIRDQYERLYHENKVNNNDDLNDNETTDGEFHIKLEAGINRKKSSSRKSKAQSQIVKDIKSLEKLEEKQEKELYNLIQHEINIRLEQQYLNKLQNKEKEREDKLRLERLAKSLKTSPEELSLLANSEGLVSEKVFRKLARRSSAMELKVEEDLRQSVKNFFEFRKTEMGILQKSLDSKDHNKKNHLIRRKSQQIVAFEESKIKSMKKLQAVAKANEEKFAKIRSEYDTRQEKVEEKKKERQVLREVAFRKRKEKSEKHVEKIQQTLMKGNRIEQQKLLDYFQKKSTIQKRKEEIFIMKQEELVHKEHLKMLRLEEIKQNLNEAKIEELKQRAQVKEKIEEHYTKINNNLKEKEKKNEMNTQTSTILRIEKFQKIKQMERYKEYERENLFKKLEEKSKIIESFQMHRQEIAERKKRLTYNSSDTRLLYKKNFDEIVRKDIDNSIVQTIAEKFPKRLLNFDTTYLISPRHTRKTNSSLILKSSESINANTNTSPRGRKIQKSQSQSSKSMNAKKERESDEENENMEDKGTPGEENNKTAKTNTENEEIGGKKLQPDSAATGNEKEKGLNKSVKFEKEPNAKEDTKRNEPSSGVKIKTSSSPRHITRSQSKPQSNIRTRSITATMTEEIRREKEIIKKVDEYRLALNEELLLMLSNERKKEETRERLSLEADYDVRKKLEKIYGRERAEATNKIVHFNNDIEKKVSEFESALREKLLSLKASS